LFPFDVATIFGQLWRLEPLPPEKKAMWRREMDWLLAVSDHIVELVPTWQSFPDGTRLEVLDPYTWRTAHLKILHFLPKHSCRRAHGSDKGCAKLNFSVGNSNCWRNVFACRSVNTKRLCLSGKLKFAFYSKPGWFYVTKV
jgi:hypothetical protein